MQKLHECDLELYAPYDAKTTHATLLRQWDEGSLKAVRRQASLTHGSNFLTGVKPPYGGQASLATLPLGLHSVGQASHELVEVLLRWVIPASIALAAAAPVPQRLAQVRHMNLMMSPIQNRGRGKLYARTPHPPKKLRRPCLPM